MTAINFPATLQAQVQTKGLRQSPGENYIESSVEQGSPKYRKRQSSAPDNYSFEVLLKSLEEAKLLWDFYKNTVSGAVTPFNFTDPVTKLSVEVRFSKAPEFSPLSNSNLVMKARCTLQTVV